MELETGFSSELSWKIFLDRYTLKDAERAFVVGDLAIALVEAHGLVQISGLKYQLLESCSCLWSKTIPGSAACHAPATIAAHIDRAFTVS